MKTRPILFGGPMVRALLDGSKSQTRREFKTKNGGVWPNKNDLPGMGQILRRCPYGQPGDRLWVRENFKPIYPQDPTYNGGQPIEYDYAATYKHGDRLGDLLGIKPKWKSSIHMPRAASRITLEIVSVRVERLQDISEADARAEGAAPNDGYSGSEEFRVKGWKKGYLQLWEQINGPGSWAANPWVWVVEFKKVTQ